MGTNQSNSECVENTVILKDEFGINCQKNCDYVQALKAFKKQTLIHHPDKGGDSEKFQRLYKAKEIVIDNRCNELEGGLGLHKIFEPKREDLEKYSKLFDYKKISNQEYKEMYLKLFGVHPHAPKTKNTLDTAICEALYYKTILYGDVSRKDLEIFSKSFLTMVTKRLRIPAKKTPDKEEAIKQILKKNKPLNLPKKEQILLLKNEIPLQNIKMSNIRIGGKARRGVLGSKNATKNGFKNIDVTSGSAIKLTTKNGIVVYARELSPLKGGFGTVADDGLEYKNFENWWQSQKIFKELGHIDSDGRLTKKFFEWRKKWAISDIGKRTLPGTSGLKPIGAYHDNKIVGYIDSREYYCSKYCSAIKGKKSIQAMSEMLERGEKIMILDSDAPWSSEFPEGEDFDWKKIDNFYYSTKIAFGHGYVIAGILKLLSSREKI